MNKRSNQPPPEEKDWQYRSIFDAAADGVIISELETGLVMEANAAACEMHGYSREEFIGLRLEAFIHPDSQELFTEYLRGFRSNDVFETRAQHIRRDGASFYGEWRGTAFPYQGRPCLLGIVRDVSQRIQTERLLQQRVETRTHEQTALLEISHTLASTLEFQPGLVLEQLRALIEYTHAGLFALEDSALVTLATRGTAELEHAGPFRLRLGGPENLTAPFGRQRSLRIADVWSDDPRSQELRALLEGGSAVLLEGMHSWMWVPLAVKSRIVGGIGVAHVQRDYFTAHHADLALSVANQASLTMVNAELYAQAQALAALEERQRLARNLHDAVNQSLFSAGLIAEVLPRLWDQDQGLARRSLEDLRKLTRGAMAEMRALLAELRPATLTDADIGDLLRLLGNAFTGRTNVPVSVTVVGQGSLPAGVQVAIYRICQEALNNVGKHAGASNVVINLKQEGADIELSLRDDGRGFDPELTTSGHYGLSMMRERAEAAGVSLEIASRLGRGTELTLHWKKPTALETP